MSFRDLVIMSWCLLVSHYGQLDMCRDPTTCPQYICVPMWRISPQTSSLQPNMLSICPFSLIWPFFPYIYTYRNLY